MRKALHTAGRVALVVMFAGFIASLFAPGSAQAAGKPRITAGCQADATGFCGGQTLMAPAMPVALAYVQLGVGAPVLGEPASANPEQDWYTHNPPITSSNAKTFEAAPGDIRSGLCISAPHAARRTLLVLRRCNDSVYQQWIAVCPGDSTACQWVSATGQLVMTDPHMTTEGTQLQLRRDRTGANQAWTFTATAPTPTPGS